MQSEAARFLQYLKVERNASELTIKSYREDLEALAEYLEQARGLIPGAGEIETLDLRGYIAAMTEAGYAKTTIARRLASLRSFFRFGQRDGWCKTNPAKPLRNPRKPRSLPHFLSNDEIERLLTAPGQKTPMELRDRAILEVLYSAGLRVSELAGLNDGDLDLTSGVLRIRGKGRKERLSPVGSFATHALRQWMAENAFPQSKAGAACPRVHQQVWSATNHSKCCPHVREVPEDNRPRSPHHAPHIAS